MGNCCDYVILFLFLIIFEKCVEDGGFVVVIGKVLDIFVYKGIMCIIKVYGN